MDELQLVPPSLAYVSQIKAYLAECLADRFQATCEPDRVPGLDLLEEFPDVAS